MSHFNVRVFLLSFSVFKIYRRIWVEMGLWEISHPPAQSFKVRRCHSGLLNCTTFNFFASWTSNYGPMLLESGGPHRLLLVFLNI